MAKPDLEIGPYRIVSTLGAGGMGVVYRARDTRSGAEVALKTLRVAAPWQLFSIRREILALATLRHPGIVRIVDHGVHDAMPWYAMELLEGRALSSCDVGSGSSAWGTEKTAAATQPMEAATERLGGGGEPGGAGAVEPARRTLGAAALAEVLSIVRRLCSPLRYLHGEGLVHGDLKPDNVLVREDGDPVIVDFGLAARFSGGAGREALQATGGAAGTIAYMSPELARGGDVDARSDIYALGCILYELLTGRPPFLGMALDVLTGHLSRPPAPPSLHADGITQDLDAFVLSMLAKEPGERPGYADDVAARLLELGALPVRVTEGEGSAPRTYLYRPRLAGRGAALATLTDLLDSACRDEGRVAIVSGASGAGKTRLLAELTRQAAARGMTSIADGGQRGRPGALIGFRQLLQAAADRGLRAGPGSRWGLLLVRLRELVPWLGAAGEAPGARSAGTGGASKADLLADLWRVVRELAMEAPLLLVIDDAQWCDELTLAAIAHLARSPELPAARVAVVVSHRASEAPEELEALPVARLQVTQLDEGEVGSIVADCLAMTETSRLAALLHARTAGIPLYVVEYLRACVAEGILERAEGRWRISPGLEDELDRALPPTLAGLLERRLRDQPERARIVLDAASVLGRSATPALLAATSGLTEGDLAAAVQQLLSRTILEEEGGVLSFGHDQIQETAYRMLDETRRRTLHRAAGSALEREGAAPQVQSELARHWHEAGEREKAMACYRAAGRYAHVTHALRDAERCMRACLALEGEAPTRESVAARSELGCHLLRFRDLRSAEAEARRALADGRRLGEPDLEARLLSNLGRILLDERRHEEATPLFEEAIRKAGNTTAERFVAECFATLATIAYQAGRVEEAIEQFEVVAERMQELGDKREEGIILGNLAALERQLGRHTAADRHLAASLVLHREVGNRRSEGILLGNMAGLELARSGGAAAWPMLEQALAIHRELGSRLYEGAVMLDMSRAAESLGRHRQARELAERSAEVLREVGDRWQVRTALRRVAALELVLGDLPAAVAAAHRAREVSLELHDDEPARIACVLGHCALAGGRSAAGELTRARELAAAMDRGRVEDAVREIEALAAAQATFERGELLDRGHVPGRLPRINPPGAS